MRIEKNINHWCRRDSSSEVSRSRYFSMKGCLSIVSASGRLAGFFLSTKPTKLRSSGEPAAISKSSFTMRARSSLCRIWKGSLEVASSCAMEPSAQMSTFLL